MEPEYIRFDWAMKRMLRDKANHTVLEGLITVLLGQKYTITKILESEGNQEDENDKFNRVDILAESDKGELIIVEVQNTRQLDYFHRILYGTSKAITEYIEKSDSYAKVRKVYSINIVYFSLGQGKDYIYHGKTVFHSLHNPEDILRLTEKQTIKFFGEQRAKEVGTEEAGAIFPEYYILKVNDFNSVVKTPLEEWMYFLKNGEISKDTRVPGLMEAREKLSVDSLSPKEKIAYRRTMENNRYEKSIMESGFEDGQDIGLKLGMEKGIALGREEGMAEMQTQFIKRLIAKGFDNETIAELSSVPIEEIQKYRG